MNAAIVSKIHKLHADLVRAVVRLKEALALPPTRIHKDATIQRFEFCFELSWKLLQSLVIDQGLSSYGPKNAIRVAAQAGIIDNPAAWLKMLDARNLTTHVYKEKTADEVYKQIKHFPPLVDQLLSAASAQQLLFEDVGEKK